MIDERQAAAAQMMDESAEDGPPGASAGFEKLSIAEHNELVLTPTVVCFQIIRNLETMHD